MSRQGGPTSSKTSKQNSRKIDVTKKD